MTARCLLDRINGVLHKLIVIVIVLLATVIDTRPTGSSVTIGYLRFRRILGLLIYYGNFICVLTDVIIKKENK